MDLNMPLMDGYETARAIRKMPGENAKVTIVATTADASLEARQRCLAAGMQGFVSKPFDIARLKGALSGGEVPPPAAASTDAPLVDPNRLAELRNQLGPQLLVNLAEAFAAEASTLPEGLHGTDEEMARSIHNLRGSAANLGLVRTVALCDELKAVIEAGSDPAETRAATLAAARQSAGILAASALAEAA